MTRAIACARALRRDDHAKDEALDAAAELEQRLDGLVHTSALPEHADTERVDSWLVSAYQRHWSARA